MDRKPTYEELNNRVRELEKRQGEQAEMEASYEQNLFQMLLMAIPDHIYFKDRDRKFVHVSQFFCDLLNRDKEDIIGKKDEDLFPKEIVKETSKDDLRVIEKGLSIINKVESAESIAGVEHWVLTTKVPWRDKRGNIIGLLGVSKDITKLKQAEKIQREAEARFRGVFENSLTGMALGQKNGRFIQVNKALSKILGYSQKELLSLSTSEVTYPGDVDQNSDQARKLWTGESNGFTTEKRYVHKEGHVVWSETTVSPLRDAEGKTKYIVGQLKNITKRKRAEKALQESEERFRLLAFSAPVGIFQADTLGKNIYSNQKLCELTGLPLEDHYGDGWSKAIHPDDREKTLNEWRLAIEGRGNFNIEFRFLTSSGKIYWVSSSIAEQFDASNHKVGFLGTLTDITKLKHMESELNQAQKMEAIGTLAGGIAHEFNNILGIIIGNTELAIDDVPDWNPAKSYLEEIKTASLRASDIVRQILSFTRKTPGERKSIQISAIIKESLKLTRATIPTTIEIKQNILCDTQLILGNPTEINLILLNLCSNAVHAMPGGEGSLDITLKAITLDEKSAPRYENLNSGDYVKLTVQDTGTGIDPMIKDRIFDPYFTTKDIGDGIGMGLAIVYGLIKKHDGAIALTSELGKGTIVEVLFPIIEGEVEKETPTAETMPSNTEKILFVDDEPALAKMAKQMLTHLGYDVVTRTNSLNALELFKSAPDRFDLVITDMAMPDMAGDRLAREMIKFRPKIPIILCSGHSTHMNKDQAKALGIKAYVMKPLVMQDFLKTIRNVLHEAMG